MSWQDRDWAREASASEPAGYPHRPGTGPFSIVSTIILANMVVFVLAALSLQLHGRIYGFGELVPLAVVAGQLWRLITAQYLHASPTHLFVNMLALHFLGRPLEDRWSARKFFAIYTLCGLCGNVFYTVLAWRGVIHPLQPAVGASGCLYGLLGIVAVLFPHAQLYVYFLFPIRIRTAAVVMGAIAFMTVVERGANYGGEACHLAGLVFGVWWALHGDEWWSSTEWALPWQHPRE